MEKKSDSLPRPGAGYIRRRHRPIWESRRSHNSNMPTGYFPISPTHTGTGRGRGREPTRLTMDQGGGEAVPVTHPVIAQTSGVSPPILPHPPVIQQAVLPPPILPRPPHPHNRPIPRPLILQHQSVLPQPNVHVLPHPPVLRQRVLSQPNVLPHPPVLQRQFVISQPNVLQQPPVLSQPNVLPHPPVLQRQFVLSQPNVLQQPPVLQRQSVLSQPNVRQHPPVLQRQFVLPQPNVLQQPPVLPQPNVLQQPPVLQRQFVLPHQSVLQPPIPNILPHPPVLPRRLVLSQPNVLLHHPVPTRQFFLPQPVPNVLPHPPVPPHVDNTPHHAPVIPRQAIHRPVLPPIVTTSIGDNSGPNTGSSNQHHSPLSTSSGDFEAHVAHQLQKAVLPGMNKKSDRIFTESGLTRDRNMRANLDHPFLNDDVNVLMAKVKTQTDYLVFLRQQRHWNTQYIQQLEEYLQSIEQEASRCHQRRLILGAEARKVSEHLSMLRKIMATNEVKFRLMVSNNTVLRNLCQRMEDAILNPKLHTPGTKDNISSTGNQTRYSGRKKNANDVLVKQTRSESIKSLTKVLPNKSTIPLGQAVSKHSLTTNDLVKNITVSRSANAPAAVQNCNQTSNLSRDVMQAVRVHVPLVTDANPSIRKTECSLSTNAAEETPLENVPDSHVQSEGRLQSGSETHDQTESRLNKASDSNSAECSLISAPENNRSVGVISPVPMLEASENSGAHTYSPGELSSQSNRKFK